MCVRESESESERETETEKEREGGESGQQLCTGEAENMSLSFLSCSLQEYLAHKKMHPPPLGPP